MFVGPRMKRDLVTVTPGATLEEAARLLTAHRIHHLPVIEEGNLLVGIVSDTNLRNATLDGRGDHDAGAGDPFARGHAGRRDARALAATHRSPAGGRGRTPRGDRHQGGYPL